MAPQKLHILQQKCNIIIGEDQSISGTFNLTSHATSTVLSVTCAAHTPFIPFSSRYRCISTFSRYKIS